MKLLCFLFFCAIWLESALSKAKHFKASAGIVGGENLGITNGKQARPNSIPSQVYLGMVDNHGNGHKPCGGALISTTYVLTAARCFSVTKEESKHGIKIVKAFVLLGADNATAIERSQQEFESKDFKVHEGWNLKNFADDIALIKLPQPAQLTKFVQPIKPSKKSIKQLAGRTGTISGWGLQNATAHTPQNLRVANITIAKNSDCKSVLFFNNATNICSTGPNNRGPCDGDAGDPLIVDKELAGLVAFGPPDCKTSIKQPVVYTKISAYIDWIQKNTGLQF